MSESQTAAKVKAVIRRISLMVIKCFVKVSCYSTHLSDSERVRLFQINLKDMQLCVYLFKMLHSKSNKKEVFYNKWYNRLLPKDKCGTWDVIKQGKSALDAVEAGCSRCEDDQCDHTVGFGGSPDENGETTLDAMIMDGPTHDVGAVAALRRVKHAISVARKVLEHTEHTLLVGDQATQFALNMGFKEENLSTSLSIQMWKDWKAKNCQPNFWKNVRPDPKTSCGPYKSSFNSSSFDQNISSEKHIVDSHNHDTIGMIVIDKNNRIAAGTSSNGASHKIPGRVGDSPVPGSGAYVDQDVGGAVATGDGDVMMRFCPTFHAVENMRHGLTPTKAAEESIRHIIAKYPSFSGAIVAANMKGEYGAACHNIAKGFPFSFANMKTGTVTVKSVECINV